jgi:hypothetical protein
VRHFRRCIHWFSGKDKCGNAAVFQANIDWLSKTLPPSPDKPDALSPAKIVAGLQGTTIVSAVLQDRTTLDRTAARMPAAYGAL